MKTSVYIAAPFFNEHQLDIVQQIENVLEATAIQYFSPRDAGVLDKMDKEDKMNSRKAIYEGNLTAMNYCTHMIAVIDTRDTGTIFEIGYFAKSSKPFILFCEELSKVNVMLSEGALAVCTDIVMLPTALNGGHNEYDNIKDTQ